MSDTPISETVLDDPDRFRKPAPIIELTPEVLAKLRELLDDVQRVASVTGLPWSIEPYAGKPYLRANKETRGCTMAQGTIGSWKELELAALAVNALPAFLASLDTIEQLREALRGSECVGIEKGKVVSVHFLEDKAGFPLFEILSEEIAALSRMESSANG